jgi:hypothetical protein
VYIEDICGELDDLVGTPITLAEEVSNIVDKELNTIAGYFTEEKTKVLYNDFKSVKHNALWDAFIIRECYNKLTIF